MNPCYGGRPGRLSADRAGCPAPAPATDARNVTARHRPAAMYLARPGRHWTVSKTLWRGRPPRASSRAEPTLRAPQASFAFPPPPSTSYPGPGRQKRGRQRPRWDPSAITGVSSRPPRDAVTPSHAPPRGTSPRCSARCSEPSSSDPGIRLRHAYSAGQPAPRCCNGPRPRHRLKQRNRMAMPVLPIAEANLTEEVTGHSRAHDASHTSRQGLHLQAPARPSHRAPPGDR
jgi:hypothetical protein